MRHTLFLILLFTLSFRLGAQQATQYTMVQEIPQVYNPAYPGVTNSLEFAGIFRKQWVGLDGSPFQQALIASVPVDYISGAVGLVLENDIIGAERNTIATLSYAQAIRLGDEAKLSVGVSGGIIQKSLNGAELLAPEGIYEGQTFDHNDDFIPEIRQNGIGHTVNAGVFLKVGELNAGFSGLHLTESKIDYPFGEVFDFRFKRHFTGMISYKIGLGENFGVTPGVFAASDLVETQLQSSVVVDYQEKFHFGAMYRGFNSNTNDALGIQGGMTLGSRFRLLYAFDLPLSGLREVNSGSHEVILKYDLGKSLSKARLPKIIHTPRLP